MCLKAIDKFNYTTNYGTKYGGVTAIRTEHYKLVNGHSNRFWGWGGEDNDMETRYYMMSVKTAAGVSFIPEITLESAIVTNMAQLGRNLVSVAT